MKLRAMLGIGSLLLIETGCPHDWVKGGTNDRAMAKDTREMLEIVEDDEDCPEGMTLKEDCSHRRPGEPCPVVCQ